MGLKSNQQELIELRHVLEKIDILFFNTNEVEMPFGEGEHLRFVAGVMTRDKINSFERMLWVASRGNVFVKRADIEEAFEDPHTV